MDTEGEDVGRRSTAGKEEGGQVRTGGIAHRHRHTIGQDPEAVEETLGQNRRVATPFMISKCEREAARNWDIFYKRHEDRFFKNKNWTEKEFAQELGKGAEAETTPEWQEEGMVEEEVKKQRDTVLLEVRSRRAPKKA